MNEKQKNSDEKDAQQNEADERSSPSGTIVYKAILKEGDDELERPSAALFWSGLAAGMSMGFSLIAEGLLRAYLPDAHWRPAVAKLGYSVGFLIVVLGRQQLFTENTLTPILPLLLRPNQRTLFNVLRMWGVVLTANMVGALIVSLVIAKTSVFEPFVKGAFVQLGELAVHPSFASHILRGIFAGWLIALMVWLLPFAEAGRVLVIVIITYVVGLGGFSHIIAGAVEVFTLAASTSTGWWSVISGYLFPTLIGNIIGGIMLVAVINHAQVVAGGKGRDI